MENVESVYRKCFLVLSMKCLEALRKIQKEIDMEVQVLSYTKEPEKTCVVSMRSTRTLEPAHRLWNKDWMVECPEKSEDLFSCPKDKQGRGQKCNRYDICAIRLIREAKKSKHWGVLEHAYYTVSVSGISRACTHQLVRHRLFSYLQSSSRMIDFSKFTSKDFIVPPSIDKAGSRKGFSDFVDSAVQAYAGLKEKGVRKEDARFVLPEATSQHIVITGNARNWLHFFYMRMSRSAQWEIRELANAIHEKLMEISPEIFRGAGMLEC